MELLTPALQRQIADDLSARHADSPVVPMLQRQPMHQSEMMPPLQQGDDIESYICQFEWLAKA